MDLRVSIAGTDALARAGLRLALERAGLEVVEEAGEVLVWDLGAGTRDDSLSRAFGRSTPVVVLVSSAQPTQDLLAAGARGVLGRDTDGARLAAALTAARAGVTVIDPEFVPSLGRAVPDATPEGDELTPRELEVLQHLSAGLANKEIAAKLAISDHTVKFHVNAILGKLGASTRTEAVVRGVRRGIVIL
ncbi:MAG: response regulator transcription factor [Myxococcales bacterium]|nr:response regulator transcription factor [Myxococcales bacterium]